MLALLAMVLSYTSLYAQSGITVSGTVVDEEKLPLVGVFISVKGTKTSTTTDLDGKYKLTLPNKEATIVFQYLGMKEESYTVNKSRVLDLVMTSDNTLDEVVITAGYGLAQKRSDMTGSAFQIEAKQLETMPATRIDNLLDGMVPGLTVDPSGTTSRSNYTVRVRGDASLSANSEPLWIVDGVPVFTGKDNSTNVPGMSSSVNPLSFINPEDIESMTVLKDAATTSIYGADGANGVIIVTTKQGKGDGSLHISASMKYGSSNVDRSTLMKYCNAEQWMSLAKEGWVNAGYDLAYFPYQDNPMNSYSTTDTNWYDVYLGRGSNSEISLRIDSGTEKASHYLSVSCFKEKSTTIGNDQSRFSVRDRASFKFGKKLTLDTNISSSYNLNNIVSISRSNFAVIPIFSPYEEDGVTPRLYNYYSQATDRYEPELRKFIYNEVPTRDFSDNRQRGLTTDGSATLQYKFFDGFTLSVMGGINLLNSYEYIYHPKTTLDGQTSYEQQGVSRRSNSFSMNWNNINRLNFNRKFGKHNVGALAGLEFVSKESRVLYATGYGFANDNIQEIGYAIKSSITGYSSLSSSRSLSYLGQLSYSYDSRYYLSASYRRQGYSSFSTYSRWGDFSSVGLSWNVHNEDFFKVPFISRLKIKGSYGNSGNSRVDTSSSYGTYTYSSGDYYGGMMGANQGTAPNPGLSWENTYIGNIGIDLGLLDDRIDIQMEYYDKYTKDLLYKGRVSSVITEGTVYRNVGEVENRGFEITIGTKNIVRDNFSWTTDFNGSFNRNIIRKLYQDMHTGFFDYVWVAGASKDAWWLSRWAGVDPATGAPMWYDADGNLTYTFSYDNRVTLDEYSKEPKLRGGLRNSFRFGDFNLSVFLTYTLGGWDYLNRLTDGLDIIGENVLVEELDHWRKPGDVSNNPRFVYKNSSRSGMASTRFMYSKTNVQLKNISFSYSIPKDFCKKMGVKSASISLIGDNLYFWTPDQSRTRNSYKTMAYISGITRSVSGQLTLNF